MLSSSFFSLHIKSEMNDVPVLNEIIFPLGAEKSLFPCQCSDPQAMKSTKERTSARINPLSISLWIFPAALGAGVPFETVQALSSELTVV